jgi:hypothetical protein
VSLGPGVPSPGIAPLSCTNDLHYGGHRVRLLTLGQDVLGSAWRR